jgi:hypothetical protein
MEHLAFDGAALEHGPLYVIEAFDAGGKNGLD